jgi:RNA polymerase sigma-70 factor (ECF subfamily)
VGEAQSTLWTVIRSAAAGDVEARELFARRYEPVIRAYFGARWKGDGLLEEMDDAVQEVFVDCFKDEGALSRADPDRPHGFRAFLYGVTRNVALRFEERRSARRERQPGSRVDLAALLPTEDHLSRVFDRSWARSLLEQARNLQARRAAAKGSDAVRRLEIMRLRFREDLPVREIARLLEMDPERVHREYAKAREEYKAALRVVVAEHHPGERRSVEGECKRLLECLR